MYNATKMSDSWLNSEPISPSESIPRHRGFTRSKVRVVDEWEQMKRDFKKKSESGSEPSDSISDDEDNRRQRLPPDRWDNCWNCCAVVEVDDDEDDEEIEYTKIPGEMEDWKEEEDVVESNKNKSKNRKDIQSHFDKLKLRFTRTDSPELPRYVDRSEPRSVKVKSGEDFRSQEHIWTGSSDLDFVY